MTKKRTHRPDDNHTEIVRAYRSLGFSVYSASQMGKGFPDLVVGIHGITDLVEVKDGGKPPSGRKLTPDQVTFFNDWNGSARVIKNTDEVAQHYKELKEIWLEGK